MVKLLALSTLSAALLLFQGCSSKQEAPTPEEQKEQMIEATAKLPEWVVRPEVKDAVAAVGIAGYSRHGMQVMLPQAQMDARAKMAGLIETEVSRLQEQVLRHSKISRMDDIDSAFKSATKEVVKKIPLSGAKQTAIYQADDGTLYVHMVLEDTDVASELRKLRSVYKEQLEEAKLSRKNIEEGMLILDKSIDELDEAVAQ